MKLGVNIDHIATLREARRINEPDPLEALSYLKRAGANQVTLHLREDRRHIVDHDVRRIIESSMLPVNVEAAANADIIDYVCSLNPYSITLVPEKREEVTTEGGLSLQQTDALKTAIEKIKQKGIILSLFIDPDVALVKESQKLGADKVELHTGRYANIFLMLYSNLSKTHHRIEELVMPYHELENLLKKELTRIEQFVEEANRVSLCVAAGHGLNAHNLDPIVNMVGIEELNIGHSIIARSIFVGLEQAIREILIKMP